VTAPVYDRAPASPVCTRPPAVIRLAVTTKLTRGAARISAMLSSPHRGLGRAEHSGVGGATC
jgi:hypothetical protein